MDFMKINALMKERQNEEWHRIYKKYEDARNKIGKVITKELELDKLGFQCLNLLSDGRIHIYKFNASADEIIAILDEPRITEKFGEAARYNKYEIAGRYRGYEVLAFADRRDSNETVA